MADSLPIDALVGRSSTTLGATSSPGVLGKDGFLTLLIEQMKHQDPMDPMDTSQYTAQLAQFQSLEEAQNQSALLEQGLQSDYILSQAINNTLAGSLVGTDVKAYGEKVNVSEGEGSDISFELSSMAEEIEILVLDGDGNEVRKIQLGRTQEGEQSIDWNGEDNAGNELADGNYTVEITMTDGDGIESEVTPYIIGTIEAVRFTSGGAMLVVDGVQVFFGDVLELRNPDGSGDNGGFEIAGLNLSWGKDG
jgi:flagellar basal-body rod modification protein FlgD